MGQRSAAQPRQPDTYMEVASSTETPVQVSAVQPAPASSAPVQQASVPVSVGVAVGPAALAAGELGAVAAAGVYAAVGAAGLATGGLLAGGAVATGVGFALWRKHGRGSKLGRVGSLVGSSRTQPRKGGLGGLLGGNGKSGGFFGNRGLAGRRAKPAAAGKSGLFAGASRGLGVGKKNGRLGAGKASRGAAAGRGRLFGGKAGRGSVSGVGGGLAGLARKGTRSGCGPGVPSRRFGRGAKRLGAAVKGAASRPAWGARAGKAVGKTSAGVGRLLKKAGEAGLAGLGWVQRQRTHVGPGSGRMLKKQRLVRSPFSPHKTTGAGVSVPQATPTGQMPVGGSSGFSDQGRGSAMSGFVFAAQAAEIKGSVGRYDPENMAVFDRDLELLPQAFRDIGDALRIWGQKVESEFPVHPRIIEMLQFAVGVQYKVAAALEEAPPMFKQVHEPELRRYHAPRPGENKWNTN